MILYSMTFHIIDKHHRLVCVLSVMKELWLYSGLTSSVRPDHWPLLMDLSWLWTWTAIMMFIRIKALYHGHKIIPALVAALGFASFIMNAYLLTMAAPVIHHPDSGVHCKILNPSKDLYSHVIVTKACTMVFEGKMYISTAKSRFTLLNIWRTESISYPRLQGCPSVMIPWSWYWRYTKRFHRCGTTQLHTLWDD